jgi:uncharacterized protein YecE (DUF72 family)
MPTPPPGRIFIGVGGWTYAPWRGVFYPENLPHTRELKYASRKLSSIEINGTYYRSQTPATFAKWREETPDGFVFSVKAPRFATTRKALADAGPSVERFLASGVLQLRDKLGPINWQFLPTKRFDPADFRAFLKLLPRSAEGRALRHGVEVRHNSFQTPEFVAMAREFGVAIVIAGDSLHPQIADLTAPFVYARIMGATERPKLGLPPKALDLWAQKAQSWRQGQAPGGLNYVQKPKRGAARDVYLYVIGGHKAKNPSAAMALLARTQSSPKGR